MKQNNMLIHHGIKGQKWGVRRFQNKDGSLTSAGRRKASSEPEHENYTRAHGGKSIKSMSDAELRQANNRLQMEQQYSRLTANKVSAGRKFATTVLVGSATSIAASYTTKYMKTGLEYIGNTAKKKAVNSIIKGAYK